MNQEPEILTKTSRRYSLPKLRMKPLTLTLNRNCYSHKSYLNAQQQPPLPQPADSFTLSKVTEKLYLGSEKDVRALTNHEVAEKGITRILSVQQCAVENFECNKEEIGNTQIENKNNDNQMDHKTGKQTHKTHNHNTDTPQTKPENNFIHSETTQSSKIKLKDKFKNIQFMHVKAADITSTNLIDDFEKCIDFIDGQEGATIVHCQAGISRSATVCLAYLIKTRGYTLDEAFDFLKTCRSCIGPNFGFLGQLKIFEQKHSTANKS